MKLFLKKNPPKFHTSNSFKCVIYQHIISIFVFNKYKYYSYPKTQ